MEISKAPQSQARSLIFARRIDGINIRVFGDKNELIAEAARALFATLRDERSPTPNIGLATGGTFEPFYEYVVDNYRSNGCSFARARTFNLDEYEGLPEYHPQSYHYYMYDKLFSRVDIPKNQTSVPNGMAKNLQAEAVRYDHAIAEQGGIDLQFLGVGANGHIGFNEPGTPFDSRTHVVELTGSTREANRRFFPEGEEVPLRAITMGIGTIMDARRIVLLATGASKAPIIGKIFEFGFMTLEIPASALKDHGHVTFLLDAEAASELIRAHE